MKKKIGFLLGGCILVVGLVMQQAQGAPSVQVAYNQAVAEACESAGDLANSIMVVRQFDVTTEAQIDLIKNSGVESEVMDEAIGMVEAAHEHELVDSERVSSVAEEFGDKYEQKCLSEKSGTVL